MVSQCLAVTLRLPKISSQQVLLFVSHPLALLCWHLENQTTLFWEPALPQGLSLANSSSGFYV